MYSVISVQSNGNINMHMTICSCALHYIHVGGVKPQLFLCNGVCNVILIGQQFENVH